MKIEFEDHL